MRVDGARTARIQRPADMVTATRPGDVPFVVARDLSKRFGADWALARATFSLERGAFAVVTGPNGSGKTTLLRCLSTALVPDFGSVSVDGLDAVAERDAVRAKVGALTHPAGFYGGLSARENLELANDVLDLARNQAIPGILERTGLARTTALLDEFWSGMRQRFALPRLALLRRELILLDEPETHLDADGLAMLRDLIVEWKAAGCAVLSATHAPERFADLIDQRVHLVSGAA